MSIKDIKYIVDRVINDHPEYAREINDMLCSFNYAQLEEYARVAKLYGGF